MSDVITVISHRQALDLNSRRLLCYRHKKSDKPSELFTAPIARILV